MQKPANTPQSPGVSLNFEAIGTVWKIEVFDAEPSAQPQLEQAILTRIDEFDKRYSRFRKDSLVTQMGQKAGTYILPDDAEPLLDLYKKLYDVSDGTVTPLIGQTLVEAGYDAEYSLKPGKLHTPPRWDDALDYNFPQLRLKRPALLDFGAAGKGYLVDIIGELLGQQGASTYLINAGGDIQFRSPAAQHIDIGLEHPANPKMAIGVAHITNQSLCGSSGSRRTWDSGKYHHIINPRTLESPRDIAAAWIVADSGLVADGLATAIFFVDPSTLKKHFDFEYAVVTRDMSLQHSSKFPAEFFN